jgi:hypothetical protein
MPNPRPQGVALLFKRVDEPLATLAKVAETLNAWAARETDRETALLLRSISQTLDRVQVVRDGLFQLVHDGYVPPDTKQAIGSGGARKLSSGAKVQLKPEVEARLAREGVLPPGLASRPIQVESVTQGWARIKFADKSSLNVPTRDLVIDNR